MDNNSAAVMSALAGFYLIFALIMVAVFALMIWLYWRIFTRAGFNGALALLNIVPGGSLVCVIILAFGRWPLEDQLAALQGGSVGTGKVPPVGPGPGGAVMPVS